MNIFILQAEIEVASIGNCFPFLKLLMLTNVSREPSWLQGTTTYENVLRLDVMRTILCHPELQRRIFSGHSAKILHFVQNDTKAIFVLNICSIAPELIHSIKNIYASIYYLAGSRFLEDIQKQIVMGSIIVWQTKYSADAPQIYRNTQIIKENIL